MDRSKRRLSLRACAALAGLLTTCAVVWGQSPSELRQTFRLSSGIVVAGEGSELFLMRPTGGIEAVDTKLGRTLWTSTDAARPIAMTGDLLLAQVSSTGRADKVGLALLAASRGNMVRATSLKLPREAWTGVDDTLGATFAVEAWEDRNDLMISWACREQTVGGADLERPAAREEVGMARLEPATGRLSPLALGAVAPPAPTQLLVPESDRLASVAGRQFFSSDGRHILASERVADDRLWEKYSWTVFDRASGERLGQVRGRWAMTEFFVAGGNLVHLAPAYQRRLESGGFEEAPLSVRGVDLASGTELWQRPIRDTKYRGPFPP